MPKRESKSKTITSIEVIGKTSELKGHLELTSGNLYYYRKGAKGELSETLRLTYQQLFKVLEREKEYQSTDTKKCKLPKPHHDGDFKLYVNQIDQTEALRFPIESTIPLKKLDPRRLELGTYQFSHSMAKRFSVKRPRHYEWLAHVSIQAALWILNRYIDKFLAYRKMSDYEDKDIVVSKNEMRKVLLTLFKKVDS